VSLNKLRNKHTKRAKITATRQMVGRFVNDEGRTTWGKRSWP